MAFVEAVEASLVNLEKSLVKLLAAEGSAVKFQKAETDILGGILKARDVMMGCVQDKNDKDRSKLLEAFGGDCHRIAKFRAVLEAIKLSDKHKDDQRLPSSMSACKLIEDILREKDHGNALRAAQEVLIPWRPPSEGAQPESQPAQEPALASMSAPEPALEPEPAPRPAPRVHDPTPKPTLQAPQSTTETVVISEGERFVEVSEEKRNITVDISVEVQPEVDAGGNGTILVKLPSAKVTLATSVTPPWPQSAKPFQPSQVFDLLIPEFAELSFDPVTKTPDGARVEADMSRYAVLMEIPHDLEVSVKSKSMSPWGSVQLHDGKEMTVVHHTATVQGAFSIADGSDSRTLSIDLACKVVFMLSGPGSARFTADGVALEPPVPGG